MTKKLGFGPNAKLKNTKVNKLISYVVCYRRHIVKLVIVIHEVASL